MPSLRTAALLLLLACSPSAAHAQQAQSGGPKVNETVFRSDTISSVTAVTEVFGRRQQITSVIVEFAKPLAMASVGKESFAVDDRAILSVRVTATPDIHAASQDGRFVVIALDPADKAGIVFAPGVDEAANAIVRQTGPVRTVGGEVLAPGEKGIINTRLSNLVVDDFRQFRYVDPETGLILDYNLFIPAGYAPGKSYPLVLFMHDAGVTGTNPRRTLQQGLGAISFASPEDQAKHPAFVLAPQYPVPLANDASQTSDYMDVTERLIRKIAADFTIDRDRIYTTGQSGGCMTSIALNVKYPDLFAASLLVAGQWDPSVVKPMADDKLWAIVSQDDSKAFPGMTAIMKVLEANGAKVTRSTWNARAAPEEMAANVAATRASGKGSNVFFTTFAPGTVLSEDAAANRGAGHVNTWVYAYAIPGVRDWLFEQRRGKK